MSTRHVVHKISSKLDLFTFVAGGVITRACYAIFIIVIQVFVVSIDGSISIMTSNRSHLSCSLLASRG